MRKQKKNNKSRGGRKGPSAASVREAMEIPRLLPITTITRTYRFISTYNLPVTITASALVGIAGAVGTATNSAVAQIARSFKLHRVSIWTPPVQGNPATGFGAFQGTSCAIEWCSIDNIASMKIADRSVNPTVPAHVSAAPPPGSALAMLQDGATGGNAMILTAPVGSVIDVHVTHVLYATGTAGGSVSASPVVIGTFYYLCLDGVGTVRYLPADDLPTTY